MATTTAPHSPTSAPATPAGPPETPPGRRVDLGRLRGWPTGIALAFSGVGAVGRTLGTVVAGLLAAEPSTRLVGLLALCVVGAAVLDTAGRTLWAAVVDRAEGRLREDLLDAALHQPLAALGEQAVGEVLDRVDDDTHDVGSMLRRQVWDALRTVFAAVPMWVVAGLTWWPAWVLFPVAGAAAFSAVRRLLPTISRAQGRRGDGLDRPRRRPRGGRHRPRRPAHQPGAGPRRPPAQRPVGRGPRALRRRPGPAVPGHPPHRAAPLRAARRDERRRGGHGRRPTTCRSPASSPSSSSRAPSWARSTRWRGTCPSSRPASARSPACASCSAPSPSPREACRCRRGRSTSSSATCASPTPRATSR